MKFERVEDKERKLYDSNNPLPEHNRRKLPNEEFSLPSRWSTKKEIPRTSVEAAKKKSPILFYFFLGCCIFAAGAFALMSLSLVGQGRSVSGDKIDLEIIGKTFAEGGEQMNVKVLMRNRNAAPLALADLVVSYPQTGADGTHQKEERRAIDTIGAGSEKIEEYSIKLFGSEGSTIPIKARLEYRVGGSNSIFIKENSLPIVLRSSPVSLVVKGPDTLTSNQEATFTVSVTAQSQESVQNLALKIDYPEGFNPKTFSKNADVGKTLWIIGNLEPSEHFDLTITGTQTGEPGRSVSLIASVGEQGASDRTISTIYASEGTQFELASGFINAILSLNGNTGDQVAVSPGGDVAGSIMLYNKLGSRIRDLQVTVNFSGDLFDPETVEVRNEGYFDSSKSRVVWSRASGATNILDPNDNLQFDFNLTPKLGTQGTLRVSIDIQGVSSDGTPYTLTNVDQATVKRAGSLQFTQELFHDSAPFPTEGPVPPKVNTETTYAVKWKVPTPSIDTSDILVTTTLPIYTSWKSVYIPQGSPLSYDTVSKTITWRVGNMNKDSKSQEVSFKIGFIPSVAQVGKIPQLTNTVKVSGYDTNASVNLTSSRAGVTTQISGGATGIVAK